MILTLRELKTLIRLVIQEELDERAMELEREQIEAESESIDAEIDRLYSVIRLGQSWPSC